MSGEIRPPNQHHSIPSFRVASQFCDPDTFNINTIITSQPTPFPTVFFELITMGLFDSWADLLSAATPWSEAEAEAVSGGTGTAATPARGNTGDELVCADFIIQLEEKGTQG
jgi:hypothetical protein